MDLGLGSGLELGVWAGVRVGLVLGLDSVKTAFAKFFKTLENDRTPF